MIRRSRHHRTQEQGKRSARRRKSVVSIGKMTWQTHLRAIILILLMTVIIDVSDAKIRNIRKSVRKDYAQLSQQNWWQQRISQRSSGLKWMRIRYRTKFISLHFFIHLILFFTVQRNLWSSFRLSKNRRGWCHWGLFKKGYQKPFAWKYWCTQQNINCWVPKRWSQIYWKFAITFCKHDLCW